MEVPTFKWLEGERDQATFDANPVERTEPAVAFLYRPIPGDPNGRTVKLEPDEIRRLADAVEAVAAGKGERPVVTKLRSEWMTAPFRLCDREEWGLLHLSAPVIYGDIAFVSVTFDCALCGHGIDFALWRRKGTWRIMAEHVRWVS